MKLCLILNLVLMACTVPLASGQCMQSIPIVQETLCSTQPYIINSSSPEFPSALKSGYPVFQLSFDVILSVTDVCSPIIMTDNFLKIFMMTIRPTMNNRLGNVIRLVNYCRQPSPITFHFHLDDIKVANEGYSKFTHKSTSTIPVVLGSTFEFLGSADLHTGMISGNYAGGTVNGFSYSFDVPAGWQFDSTTAFYICTDTNQNPHLGCKVERLSIWYSYIEGTPSSQYLWGSSTTLLRDYKINEGVNSVLTDSSSQSQNAYLGSSTDSYQDNLNSPSWLTSESGVTFTSANQFISIPMITVQPSILLSEASLTVSFWIKLNSTTSGYLFRIASSDLLFDKISLTIGSNRRLTALIGTSSIITPAASALPLSKWSLITANYLLAKVTSRSLMSISIGDTLTVSSATVAYPVGSIVFDSTNDIVRIGGPGGFSGSIVNFKLFSPGSWTATYPTCIESSTCLLSPGNWNPEECLYYQCAEGCTVCYDDTPNGCLSCNPGHYYQNSQCIRCYTYQNGSCLASCDSPYITSKLGDMYYCDFPCNTSLYYYENSTCLSSCSSPYTSSSDSNGLYCNFPCDPQSFLYLNQYCIMTCNFPQTSYNDSDIFQYCEGPCSNSSLYYYHDLEACHSSCVYPYSQDLSTVYNSCSFKSFITHEILSTTQTITKSAIQALSIISYGSFGSLSIAMTGKIFAYIKYINLLYSGALEEAFTVWTIEVVPVSSSFMMPERVKNIESGQIPDLFLKRSHSSSFILNYWASLMWLTITTGVFLFLRLSEWAAAKIEEKEKTIFMIKKLRIRSQNFFLTQFYCSFGNILFFSILQYRSVNPGQWDSDTGLTVSLILMSVIALGYMNHYHILSKYQRLRNGFLPTGKRENFESFITEQKANQVLFKDFKDDSILQQSFGLILVTRDILISLILATMFETPLAQIILIILLNLAMIIYLLLKKPLKSTFDKIQQLTAELLVLAVSINVFIIAASDNNHAEAFGFRESSGRFIIVVNMMYNLLALFFITSIMIGFYKSLNLKDIPPKENMKLIKPSQIANLSSSALTLNTETPLEPTIRILKSDVPDTVRNVQSAAETLRANISHLTEPSPLLQSTSADNLGKRDQISDRDISLLNLDEMFKTNAEKEWRDYLRQNKVVERFSRSKILPEIYEDANKAPFEERPQTRQEEDNIEDHIKKFISN